ncbi:uncharacterized protein CTRU02_200803 [Colletotrichum truncatum]|uniref:Uncharacterized protein n=1 Tax=Colletotrichum truncatum TaxID=5467 RepID=A0ACC3ZFL3_COLTU|nr:uncharacterized protein CTRU02_00570 [Colletotrichum truncatum]KAF6801821.1 hypothetical protein CTRU02_00570 [Colletotrichum truncatum]
MHPLSFLLILFSTAAALPATPATPTTPPPCTMKPPTSPPPRPCLPTGTLQPIDDNDSNKANPTPPSPIYTTIRFPFPSNSSANASVPCASIRRPLRLGPARLHKSQPSPTSNDNDNNQDKVTPAAVAAAVAAVETPDDGPRDYASLIPPAPGVTPRPEPNLAELGYYQTTYYSCATRGVSVHCGWHRPIMVAPAKASEAAAAAGIAGSRAVLITAVIGVVVALFMTG